MKSNQKYVNKSLRLKNYNYNYPGSYFITICIKDRKCSFGEIKHGEMQLNNTGIIARYCWADIPNHFMHVELGPNIVMPNHVHGIITLCDQIYSPYHEEAFENTKNILHAKTIKMHKRLPTIMGSYKAAVSKQVNNMYPELNFKWQTSYYDHIIRNEKALIYISEYILNNPIMWEKDLKNVNFAGNLPPTKVKQLQQIFYKKLFSFK